MTNVDVLNRGVPIELPQIIVLNYGELLSLAKDPEKFNDYYNETINLNICNINSMLNHKFFGEIPFPMDIFMFYDYKTKANQLHMMFDYVNLVVARMLSISDNNYSKEDLFYKISKFSNIKDEDKLQKEFPGLYIMYDKLRNMNTLFNNELIKNNGDINCLKELCSDCFDEDKEAFIKDILKINNVKSFCKIFGNFLDETIKKEGDIKLSSLDNTYDILENVPFDDSIELYFAFSFLDALEETNVLEEKQKYLYYLNSFFNSNKNSDCTLNILNEEYTYNDLYDKYINVLINNPGLKVVNYERDEFETFTPEEVEEYMKLELSDAKANWIFLDNNVDEDRVSRAIDNSTKGIKDNNKKKKTEEELKELFLEKKMLFENNFNYRVVEGKNTFDGYIAFIYPNGRVILERFFEKRKDGSEVLAREQAIYAMNIDEFYFLTNLSKTEIIRDKLCKRYIHKGDWQDKVIKDINQEGINPNKDYKKLVLTNKIKDNNQ